jgi:hypothetical protein
VKRAVFGQMSEYGEKDSGGLGAGISRDGSNAGPFLRLVYLRRVSQADFVIFSGQHPPVCGSFF